MDIGETRVSAFHRSDRSAAGQPEPPQTWLDRRFPGGRRAFWIVSGLILLGILIWAVQPSKSPRLGPRDLANQGPVPIGQASSTKGDLNVSLDALGAVTPLATVTVKPQVSGTLEKIDFQEGQMVGAGAVLAEVDPRPYQALLDQAKGALAKDEAQLANAKVDLSRYQMLWSQNAISQQTVATQQALVRTDAGTIETDKAAVEGAALNLSYCRITSPVAGRVGLRQVDVGNLVQVGVTTAIVVVTQLQPMSIEFTVPEDQIGEIVRRVGAGAKLPVEAFDRSQTTKLADGTLSTLDNEVDPTTGTVKMRALFDNKDNRLFPSQFVNIRLVVNTLRGQTIVPGAAIQHGTSGDYVYVVKPDHTVSQRNIKVGPTDGEKVDVLSGLAPNELVVVDGADRLRDGAKVVVPGSKGAAADSGAPAHHRHRRRNPDTGDDGGN